MLQIIDYQKQHAKEIISWIKDENTYLLWSVDVFHEWPLSPETLHKNYMERSTEEFFPYVIYDNDTLIGHLTMRYENHDYSALRFGYIIMNEAFRGRGYGKKMLDTSFDMAFRIHPVNKITIHVFENNTPAIRCYEALHMEEDITAVIAPFKNKYGTWNFKEYFLTRETFYEKK